MTIRIGFVGSRGVASFALGESLVPLLPPDSEFVLMTIPEARERVADDDLTLVIVALDGESWRDNVRAMTELHADGERHSSVVFGLVPRDDPAALVKAFDLGVADVAGLPIDPYEVKARLAVLARRRMVAAARHAEMRAAWRLAVTDPVTGLFNRQHLQAILPAAVASASAGDRLLALLMLDLDALKPFNDRWGHAAGDSLLRRVADAVTANMRDTDTVARLGGDEMVVVMPDADSETAHRVATRIVEIVSNLDLRFDSMPAGPISVSIGLAVLGGPDDDAERLLSRADAALYRAKALGRNRVAACIDASTYRAA
jgi:two-component system cell cycle response regulator